MRVEQHNVVCQAKTFGFNEISFHFASLNTEIFCYKQISHLSTADLKKTFMIIWCSNNWKKKSSGARGSRNHTPWDDEVPLLPINKI